VYSPLLHDVKKEIGNIKDDTQEIKELTSQIRNVQIGHLLLNYLTNYGR
jgi:hypothetical protein